MKLNYFRNVLIVAALLVCAPHVFAQKVEVELDEDAPSAQTVTADPGVVISICIESGNINAVGNDKNEVSVAANSGSRITLRRAAGTTESTPAARLEVVVDDRDKSGLMVFGECRGTTDLDIQVPRGATVYVKTGDGDIEISNIAETRAETASGRIHLSRIAKAVEASTVSGDVSLEDSSGRLRLRSISGNLEAIRTNALEATDFLLAKTISGEVSIEDVAQARVEAGTISGDVSFSGSLANGGFYDFKTTTGDVTFNMPANVSFQVTAKVSQGGEVVTDFPLKYSGGISTIDGLSSGKLAGSYGTGTAPAKINLVSFSGTLRLRKR